MAHASKSAEFNLVGSWSRNAVYSGCSAWSWTDVEMEEAELVQEISSGLISLSRFCGGTSSSRYGRAGATFFVDD